MNGVAKEIQQDGQENKMEDQINYEMEKEFKILSELGVDEDELNFLRYDKLKKERAERWD